jgi:hypothetical protein
MPYTVIPLRIEEHQEALLKLWKDNFQDPVAAYSQERFAWLYQESPVDSARTWLAVETKNNTVIGCGSLVLSKTHIGEHVVRTGMAAVLVVEKNHRTAGAALAIQRAIIQNTGPDGFDCLIGEPNDLAYPIFARVGYRPVGNVYEWVKPIDTEVELPGSPDSSLYTDEILDAADERFDRLWNQGKFQYRIVSEKVAPFLNWRYSTFKEARYRHYCLLRRGDRQLLGYVVFCAWRECSIIADIFCADLSGRIVEDLLLGFAARMRMEGQQWISLTYFGAPWFEEDLKRLGFAHGKHQRKLVAHVDASFPPDLRDVLFEKNNWFILGGEMDLF